MAALGGVGWWDGNGGMWWRPGSALNGELVGGVQRYKLRGSFKCQEGLEGFKYFFSFFFI